MHYSKRASEKRDMQNLNQRLEYYVGVNKRQHSDYLRMKESLRSAQNQFDNQMGKKASEISSTESKFATERSSLSSTLTNALGQANSAEAERVKLSQTYGTLTGQYVATDRTVQEKADNLGRLATELKATQAKLDKARRDLNSRETQSASLQVKLSEVKRDIAGLDAVTSNLNGQLEATVSTTVSTKTERTAKSSQLGCAITERKNAQKALEKELREEFESNLAKFVAHKAGEHQGEKDEWLKIFNDAYNTKIVAYKAAHKDLACQIRDLHSEKQGITGDILSRKSQIAQLTTTRRNIEADIDAKRAQYDSTNKTIRDLKAALARKSQEFDELLAARTKLEAEVSKYAELVAGEERRTGLDNASK